MTADRKPFDPKAADDPVARQTAWSPASAGGASFRTHRLVVHGTERAVFHPSVGAFTFSGVFTLIGAAFLLGTPRCIAALESMPAPARELETIQETDEDGDRVATAEREPRASGAPAGAVPGDDADLGVIYYPLMGFGAIFALFGLFAFYRTARPAAFDKRFGLYWKGYERPRDPARIAPPHAVKLEAIHALQLVGESMHGGEGGSFKSCELNLVLADASRVNVVDHGDAARLRADARTLGEFLGVPVWDAL